MTHRLIVLPDDTADAIRAPMEEAERTLNIRMFLFTDQSMLNAVLRAHARGVRVRVMLNPARRNGDSDNEETRAVLLAAGIEVRDSSDEFAVTHQKSMVIDDKIGLVESLNWEEGGLTGTRDYAVVTSCRVAVAEMVRCFNADWDRTKFVPNRESSLIWCPNNGRERIAAFIDAARETLWIQNERYQDTMIIERLVRAINRGVKVRIVARPPHKLKRRKLIEGVAGLAILQDVGAKVRQLKKLKLHGKILLADDRRAIVGSINLTPGSFDSRRELAIETESHHVVERLVRISRHDWKHSRPVDLSDDGVGADLAA